MYAIARLHEVSGNAAPEGYNYRYDQLNRLTIQRSRADYTLSSTFAWNTASVGERPHFQEDASYDPNGNILTYRRLGANSADYLMDSLEYHYGSEDNRLLYITDHQTNYAAYADDLEDQSSGNYTYDETGNLYEDGYQYYDWTNAQKLGYVSINPDHSLTFRYNPTQQHRVAKYEMGRGWENRLYYIRDAQGNVMATYKLWKGFAMGVTYLDSFKLMEQHIYGSARVGYMQPEQTLYPVGPQNPNALDSCRYTIFEGWKRYEITNHLGNVLAVITDRKRGKGSYDDIEWFAADVLSTQQYYPFGMLMPGDTSATLRRQYSLNSYDYRYGFNTQEKDNEIAGSGNSYTAEFWQYDPRSGRRWNVDPKQDYSKSVYSVLGNNPIINTDIHGDTLRGVNKNSGERALGIIRGTFNEMGPSGYNMAKLFRLKADGVTFSSINESKFNDALSLLTPEGQALAVGYRMAIEGRETNVIEVLKRNEKISAYGQEVLGFAKSGKELDEKAGGGHTESAKYQPGIVNVVHIGGTGSYAALVTDSKAKIFYNDKQRPSLPGELLAHELIGHGLGSRFGVGVDASIQATNMYLKVSNRSYYRADHSPAIHNSNFNSMSSRLVPKFLSSRIPYWIRN